MIKGITLLLLIGLSLSVCAQVPAAAEDVCPIKIGETLPALTFNTVEGESVNLKRLLQDKPAVLVFYRGGWCPYCNVQLGQMQKIEQQLLDMGLQILAVSPDRPEKLKASLDKNDINYQLLSDSSMSASRSLGIAFKVDDETVKVYKDKYKIDIEADSGFTHHQLPVPAVLIVDRQGVVQFSYINPNYKVRADTDVILAAARAVSK